MFVFVIEPVEEESDGEADLVTAREGAVGTGLAFVPT